MCFIHTSAWLRPCPYPPHFLLSMSSLTAWACPFWLIDTDRVSPAYFCQPSGQTSRQPGLAQIDLWLYPGPKLCIFRFSQLPPTGRCVVVVITRNHLSSFLEAYLEDRFRERFSFAYARLIRVLPVWKKLYQVRLWGVFDFLGFSPPDLGIWWIWAANPSKGRCVVKMSQGGENNNRNLSGY